MKFNYLKSISIIILISYSCNGEHNRISEKQNHHQYDRSFKDSIITSEPFYNEDRDTLKKAVETKGDTIAYQKLQIIYLLSEELLPYSIIMADKYNYDKAPYMVYLCITENIYPKTKNESYLKIAIEYLKKGVKNGDNKSRLELGELYKEGRYVEQNSHLGEYLLEGGFDYENYKRDRSNRNEPD